MTAALAFPSKDISWDKGGSAKCQAIIFFLSDFPVNIMISQAGLAKEKWKGTRQNCEKGSKKCQCNK